MLNALVLTNRTIENDAFPRVFRGAAQGVMTNPDGLGTDQDTFGVQAVKDIVKAFALFSNAIFVRNKEAVDENAFESTALRPILLISWTSTLVRSISV